MSDLSNPRSSAPRRRTPVECPHCGQATMPNLLSDGSYICSCPAERALPLGTEPPAVMPPPVDDPSFVPSGHAEHALPPGDGPVPAGLRNDRMAGAEADDRKADRLPVDQGQFGTNIATEEYQRLGPPPGGSTSG